MNSPCSMSPDSRPMPTNCTFGFSDAVVTRWIGAEPTPLPQPVHIA